MYIHIYFLQVNYFMYVKLLILFRNIIRGPPGAPSSRRPTAAAAISFATELLRVGEC